ncbi:MAG TPA: multicopper oxidase domain-containing protein [Rhodocyclaceae bacterium]|nr:multicopper oxidase domain-containing protein [Rhodocyclaceae bacterium]
MWTRRNVLKSLGAGAATVSVPWTVQRVLAEAAPDLVLRLTAAADSARIWPGAETAVLRYAGEVVRGRAGALRPSASYLGPTLELRRGERVRVEFHNDLDEPSVIHWHGMLVPEEADGHPRFAIGPGGQYRYEFTVRNPAGTYLYHPHPHGRTGAQVYRGLAGLLIVREAEEAQWGLPGIEQELSLVLQDRRARDGARLAYAPTMMDAMNGVLGDTVLVNGLSDAAFAVSRRPWRLRLANVSNARIYKLAWSDGRPMQVIATDNGVLSAEDGVQERPYVVLAPFERIELVEDFGTRSGGTEVALISRAYGGIAMMEMMSDMMGRGDRSGGMMGGMMDRMMGGMMGAMMTGPAQGDELPLARFRIEDGPRTAGRAPVLPSRRPWNPQPRHELHTRLAFRHMRGLLNGRRFEMGAVAADERLPLGEATLWTFANDGPGMAMPHPMHIHGVRFRVVERRGGDVPAALRDGLVDAGFKDTFLIFAGETVRVLLAPSEPGLFMYHCHNLEHEDGGMMRNCRFGTSATAGPT